MGRGRAARASARGRPGPIRRVLLLAGGRCHHSLLPVRRARRRAAPPPLRMTHRYAPATSAPKLRALPFTGLRSAFADGYGPRDLRSDVLAGLVVGVVALPLSMALAIAVGVPPQHGLYTAIVAGLVVPLLGGSRFQVTGPTAAFVVILPRWSRGSASAAS